MKTIQLNIYKFDELNDEAKQVAIEKQREWEYECGNPLMWFSETYNEKFSDAGFTGTEIQYSLSYCQGDGLSFSAKDYDNLEQLYLKVLGEGKEKTAKLLAENTTVNITGNTGRYCYASKSDVELYIENYTSGFTSSERMDEVCAKVEKELQEIYLTLCKELEDIGYKEIEYANSDEAISETIRINEYDFLEDGTQF